MQSGTLSVTKGAVGATGSSWWGQSFRGQGQGVPPLEAGRGPPNHANADPQPRPPRQWGKGGRGAEQGAEQGRSLSAPSLFL